MTVASGRGTPHRPPARHQPRLDEADRDARPPRASREHRLRRRADVRTERQRRAHEPRRAEDRRAQLRGGDREPLRLLRRRDRADARRARAGREAKPARRRGEGPEALPGELPRRRARPFRRRPARGCGRRGGAVRADRARDLRVASRGDRPLEALDAPCRAEARRDRHGTQLDDRHDPARHGVRVVTGGELDDLLAAIRRRSAGRASALHGDRHWQCVAHTGADLAREVPGADRLVVFLFGLLHDSMRENDDWDPGHGERAAVFVRELAASGLLPLESHRLDALCDACERHTDGEATDDPTIGVCWDADRLNLWRVGTKPQPDYLSTKPARRAEWIAGTPALARRAFEWPALLAGHCGPPTSRSFWVEAGRLLAGPYAGPAARDLAAAGVTAFVDLTEAGELEPYTAFLDGGARHTRFPIADFSCATAERMREIHEAIDDELARDGIVYVHCRGGCGRTGTVVGCWLVRHGVRPDVALARYAAVSGGSCPATDEQRAMVH